MSLRSEVEAYLSEHVKLAPVVPRTINTPQITVRDAGPRPGDTTFLSHSLIITCAVARGEDTQELVDAVIQALLASGLGILQQVSAFVDGPAPGAPQDQRFDGSIMRLGGLD